ncbi:MAG: sterol desaturase family protein [Spirochaetales bacterium]|nr:sterol desaturase family protein [Spirochaetales bacterium]
MSDYDGQRDSRGEWKPEEPPKPGPIFKWPPDPKGVFKFFFAAEGYFRPWNLLYLILAVVSTFFLTPSMERMVTFSFDWIALIFLRNAAILTLLAGGLHLRLYMKRKQGTKYKYSDKWLAANDKKFLFKNQTRDNVFFSIVSGCGIWTAYEAVTLWMYANKLIPYIDWNTNPVYFVFLLVVLLFIREVHFYLVHRLSHWKPLYKISHYLHHKNVNVGPWSGLAMHPIEHLLYFSGVLLHWVIPSHPVHAIAHLMHAGIAPAQGHSGFYRYIVKDNEDSAKQRNIKADAYFHYIHHRFFTVNFGNEAVPLDKWFGSFHDGTPEAHAAMMERRKRIHQVTEA